MIADYVQKTENETITHLNCEYIVFDINDLENGEVLAQAKVKNNQGEYVGLIPFIFNYTANKSESQEKRRVAISKKADVELEKY